MALHAGSHEHFGGTLAAAIENAFAGEVMAAKGQPLPDMGKEDRRILFNAIAQGMLDYLRAREPDLQVVLSGLPAGASAALRLLSPSLSAARSGSNVNASGDRWPSGTVTLVWEDTGDVAGTTTPSGGAISASIPVPPALSGTRARLGARNQLGDAVVIEVQL